MIDTDKYEGHLYEDRDYDDDNLLDVIYFSLNLLMDTEGPEREATAALLDDAPLLLEEVKRLRSIADDLYAYIVSDADISLKIIEEQMDWREEE